MFRMRHVEDYLQENLAVYFFVTLLFIIGIAFGALAVKALNDGQKAEILGYLQVFLQGIDGTLAGTEALLQQSVLTNLKTLGLVWFFGLLVLGLPVVLVILFTKGFALGFTVGFLVYELGWKGVLFSFASVLPANLFFVPALFIMTVAAVSFASVVVKGRLLRQGGALYPQIFRYAVLAIGAGGVSLLGSLVEVYISPVFMALVSRLIV